MQDQSNGTKINSKAKAKVLSTVPIKGMITKTSQVSSTIMQDQSKVTALNSKIKTKIPRTCRSTMTSALALSIAWAKNDNGAARGSR